MSRKTEGEEETSFTSTWKAIKMGLLRSGGAIVEYPVECIKSRWQGRLGNVTVRQVMLDAYKTYGVKGYYHGFLPGFAKKLPVQLYRWPMILQWPKYFEEKITPSYQSGNKYSYMVTGNVITGVSIGSLETIVAAPFETCRLELIINRERTSSVWQYLKDNFSFRQQYLGVSALYMKECLGWISFLTICNLSRALIKGKNQQGPILFHQLLVMSLFVGIINATVVVPWEVIRTQIQQMSNPTRGGQPRLGEVAQNIVKKMG